MVSHGSHDIEYCVPPMVENLCPPKLIIDYNLTRLKRIKGIPKKCCELMELEPALKITSLRYNCLPYTPHPQIAYDLAAAGKLLGKNGSIEIIVHDRKVIKSVLRICSMWFESVKKDIDNGNCLICKNPIHKEPTDIYSQIEFTDSVTLRKLILRTRRGLFSFGRADIGSRLLLENVGTTENLNVLDIGCGYGLIGLVLAARGAKVTMIDVDARAVNLARYNLSTNQLAGSVELHDGSEVYQEEAYDLVVANPPTHAGSEALKNILISMIKNLRKGGACFVVVREHLNYEKWLENKATVNRMVTQKGYKILKIERDKGAFKRAF